MCQNWQNKNILRTRASATLNQHSLMINDCVARCPPLLCCSSREHAKGTKALTRVRFCAQQAETKWFIFFFRYQNTARFCRSSFYVTCSVSCVLEGLSLRVQCAQKTHPLVLSLFPFLLLRNLRKYEYARNKNKTGALPVFWTNLRWLIYTVHAGLKWPIVVSPLFVLKYILYSCTSSFLGSIAHRKGC